jgi:hypothetical protein
MDNELMDEVIDMVLADYPRGMAAINAIKLSVESRNREGSRMATHALRGATGNLGGAPLVERLRTPETIAGEETINRAAINRARAELVAEGSRLTAALRTAPARLRGLER